MRPSFGCARSSRRAKSSEDSKDETRPVLFVELDAPHILHRALISPHESLRHEDILSYSYTYVN